MNPFLLIPMTNIMMAILLSVLVMRKNPKSPISRAFGCGLLCIIIITLGYLVCLASSVQSRVLFWYKFSLVGVSFLPLTWLLISLLLMQPNPETIIRKGLRYLLLLLVVGVSFMAFLPTDRLVYIPADAQPPFLQAIRFGTLGRWFLIYLLLSVVAMLIVLENTYRNARQKEGRHTLYGLMGGLVYAIFLCSQGLLYSRIPSAALLVGSAVITLAGLFIAYDIVRYGLFQVEIYVGRGAVYSSAILLLVGAYLILVGVVGKLVKVIGGNLNLFLTILAAFVMLILLLVLLVSGSLKRRLRVFIDRNFYKGRYDYREQWLRFSEELASLLSLEDFLPGFLHMVMDTLNVCSAAVLLQWDTQGDFLLAEAQNVPTKDFRISEKSEFLDWLFILSQPITLEDSRFSESPVSEVQSQRDRLRSLGFTVVVPLITKRKLVGLLVLGPRKSGDLLSSVDLELLEAIGNHLSVAILNLKLSEELVLSKEWEFINKISSFVVHDLKNLVSSLSMLLQNAGTKMEKPEFRESMLTTIAGTVEKMKGLMNRMTTMPKDLQLNPQPQDFNNIVRGVISKIRGSQMAGIQYIEDLHPLPLVNVDRDYAERILRNLIVNALEAMGKEGTLRVSTKLWKDGSLPTAGETLQFVEVEVADTGTGMGDSFVKHKLFRPFQTTKEKGLGIGLYQCKEAVEAHGGHIEVRSKEGQGTIFLIRLPVNHPNSTGGSQDGGG
ncbi:MAG: hypothetical protein AMJ92_03315 [candidate division Zixibacteria bacterium SM23_81]|nr:MAG: hypothetical protein AMJ92_03315 [candidate division Zixibacteria bacterium SM23_81]